MTAPILSGVTAAANSGMMDDPMKLLGGVGGSLAPWALLAGGIVKGAGAELENYRKYKRQLIEDETERKKREHEQSMDLLGQFNKERQLGMEGINWMEQAAGGATKRANSPSFRQAVRMAGRA